LWVAQTLSQGLIGLLQARGFQFFGVTFTLDPNWRVLIFGTAVTCLTCLMFGVTPAIVATRPKAGMLLRAATRTSTPRIGVRRGLVVVQIALSVVLVVTALLFGRTLYKLTTADSGLDLGRVTVVVVDYQRAQVPAERRLELQGRLLDAARSVPGVQSAASVRMVPLTGESWNGHVVIDGSERQTETYFNRVSPAFFQTVGTTLMAGRDFAPDDALSSRRVAIVNESFARQLIGARDPIGKTFQMPASPGASQPLIEVVGLVRDAKNTSLREPFSPMAFFPTTQERRPPEYVNLVVRATSMTVARSVVDAVARIEPDTVVLLQPFPDVIGDSLVRERLMATLSGFFGGVAAFLAMLGLYGVVAYGVTERTREIGIRTALGARPSEVVGLVLRQSAWLTAPGVALGLAAAAAATRLFRSLLYDLAPVDPMTFIGVAVAFAIATALAACLPARRAAKVDPLIALRSE
jgi:putative ABC transport system permease protein